MLLSLLSEQYLANVYTFYTRLHSWVHGIDAPLFLSHWRPCMFTLGEACLKDLSSCRCSLASLVGQPVVSLFSPQVFLWANSYSGHLYSLGASTAHAPGPQHRILGQFLPQKVQPVSSFLHPAHFTMSHRSNLFLENSMLCKPLVDYCSHWGFSTCVQF